uniref:Factor of DNA methylation 1-5/IDN2 domain-containing protein n=1 Tax=Brassica campestris TaxID=3711 RepID=M4D7X9_BRACM
MNDKDEELKKVIMDLEEERSDLEDANSELCQKLCESNDEIREAHKELISGLRDLSDESSTIRVKNMGRVDEKPFLKVCEQRFSGQDVALQHARLCSEWQKMVMDSRWEPFKIQRSGDKIEGVVDEEDEKLKNLSEEWGEDVKKAVKTALEELYVYNGSGRDPVPVLWDFQKELYVYNGSGRYPVPVLWNFQHGRKATVKEGIIAHMKHQIKNLKRKRT